jgi:transcriptional regulator with XRE-family HTH domain
MEDDRRADRRAAHRAEVKEFLSSRRARINPEQTGFRFYGGNRRIKGLRRGEVAMLAGMSVDYYVRMERGDLAGVSDRVLDSLAIALQLDEAERDHLFALARVSRTEPSAGRRTSPRGVRPAIKQVLDAITDTPAWVRNDRQDVIVANHLALALYAPMMADQRRPANQARFIYLDPASREFFANWERAADETAAILRLEASRHPQDKALTELIGELSTQSEAFRKRWAAHNVRFHRSGVKKLRHPVVGDLDLNFEAMELPSDPGLTLMVYTAAPGTASADALRLLALWAADQGQASGSGIARTEPDPGESGG